MNKSLPFISAALSASLFVSGCVGNFADDGFAHGVKTGNSRMAIASMQPGQARLHIYERDGRWYYPIQYAIVRGDAESTFALIHNGSPTSLQGKSLAYNAAKVKREALARQLATAGYGSHSDIAQADAENRQSQQHPTATANAGAALATVALFALLSNSGDGASDSYYSHQEEVEHNQAEWDAVNSYR